MAFLQYTCFLLLLASPVLVKGNWEDDAMRVVQGVAEEIKEKIDEVADLSSTTRHMVKSKFSETQAKMTSSVQAKVDAALNKAQEMQCHPDATAELEVLPGSVTDRFLNCINFTETIAELEKFIYDINDKMGGIEDLVCVGIQNVTSCAEKSIMAKIACMSDQVANFIQGLKDESSNVKEAFAQIKAIGDRIVNAFFKCFTTVDYIADEEISAVFAKHCSQKTL